MNKQKEIPAKIKEQVERVKDEVTRKEVIKYIIACILFGSLTYANRHISIGILELTFVRVAVATFFLMTIFCCSTRRATLTDYTKKQLVYLIISGVCIGTTWLIIADSTKRLGVTITTLTYSLGPGLLLLLSPILFKDVHFTPTKIIGFIVCSLGVLFMDYQWFVTPHGFWTIFDVIVAALFTVVIVYCNRKLETINGLENAMFQVMIAFVIIGIIFIWKHGLYFNIPSPDSWWILIMGIVNTGLPVYLYLSSIDDLRPDTIAFAGYIRPIMTIVISIIYGDVMPFSTYFGAVLILGGVAIANFFRRKHLRKNRNF